MTGVTKRAAAFLVALLLVLTSLGSALGAHPCPHHGGVAAAGAFIPGHGSDGSLVGHGYESGHDQHASPGSEAHGPCTCVGQCQASAAPPMPAPAVGTDLPTPPASPHAFLPARPLLRATIVPFSLPWGNAPPTL